MDPLLQGRIFVDLVEHDYTVDGRSVVIYTTQMSKACPVVEYVAIIVIRRTAERTGPITKWPARRLLFFRLEIVFVTISLFTKRTKVVQKAL